MTTEFFTEKQSTFIKPTYTREPAMTANTLAILPANELLRNHDAQLHCHKLQELLKFPAPYTALCTQTMANFAAFAQQLPATESSYYSNHHGLLLHGLDRASIATTHYYHQLLPHTTQYNLLSETHALWLYVVFTSALLHRLGHVITKLQVRLQQTSDKATTSWQPLAGAMSSTTYRYYHYQFVADNDDYLSYALTRYFARQIVPEAGFNWITSDNDVLKIWLALLEEDWQRTGSLASLIPLSQLESVMQYFNEKQQQIAQQYKQDAQATTQQTNTTLFNKDAAQTNKFGKDNPEANAVFNAAEAAAAFLQWLQKNIQQQNKNITINKDPSSAVQVTKEGVLLTFPKLADLIKEFQANSGNQKINALAWTDVVSQLTQLGVSRADNNNNHIRQVRLGTAEQTKLVKAILISNVQTIFLEGTPPESKVPYAMINPHPNIDHVLPQTGHGSDHGMHLRHVPPGLTR